MPASDDDKKDAKAESAAASPIKEALTAEKKVSEAQEKAAEQAAHAVDYWNRVYAELVEVKREFEHHPEAAVWQSKLAPLLAGISYEEGE